MQKNKVPKGPRLFRADQAINKLIAEYEFNSVLDVGCGAGLHSDRFRASGKRVTGIDYQPQNADVIAADFLEHEFDNQFDCVWASHVLEHQPNVNLFLRKVFGSLREGGVMAITVPPLKHEIVGGHLTLWNTGILLYNLILAGFDCREARCKQYGYNISVITPKVEADVPFAELRFANGDIEKLARFFPKCLAGTWRQAFNGSITELNWTAPGIVYRPRKKNLLTRFGLKKAS
jgi:SAM-dependent methyltransferase